MSLAIHQIDDTNGMVITQIDEITPKHPMNNTKDTCKLFVKRYSGHKAGLFLYGDPAGKHEDTRSEAGHNDYRIIEKELKNFRPRNRVARRAPSIIMRGNFINDIFNNSIDNLSIFIADNCVLTKKDYNFVKEDSSGKKQKKVIRDPKTGVSYEELAHLSDANDYFYCELLKNEYNLYQQGGKMANAYIPEATQNSKLY